MKITIDKANVSFENGKIIIDVDQNQLYKLSNMGTLSNMKPGCTFMIGDKEFVVLEHTENGTRVISKEFVYSDMKFGDCSDWRKSPIRTKLHNDYYKKISAIVGENNIIPMERDLTSLDGLDDYGTCTDTISLLTAAEYAKYHKILGLKSNYPDWWWTITPTSTPSNDYSRRVCYVGSYGILCWNVCDYSGGVRPFLTLDSSLLIS